MGRALVEATFPQLSEVIRHWCCETGFTPGKHLAHSTAYRVSSSGIVQLTAKSHFTTARWRFTHSGSTSSLNFELSPRLHYSLTLFGLSLGGLSYCIVLIARIMNEYRGRDVITFMMCALLVLLCGWWQRRRIEPRLTRMEHSFWSKVQQSYDLQQVSYSVGRLYVPRLNLTIELAVALGLILFCGGLMGAVGAGIAFLACVLVISRHVVGILQDRNPYSQWQLCLMDNVTAWTLLTLMLLGVFAVLCAMEAFLPQRLYLAETPTSPRQAMARVQFRPIVPRRAHALEDDCARYFHGLAEHDFSSPGHLSDAGSQTLGRIRHREVAYGYFFMVLLWVPVYFFSVRPFWALLRKQRTWALETTNCGGRDGPSTLYLPQAWKWRSTVEVRCVVILHYLCGATVNITAAILCVDSLTYAFLGHSIFLANTANLCSWVFSSSKIALGPNRGQIAAVLAIIALSLPVLFLAGAFMRRTLFALILRLRILRRHRDSQSHHDMPWLQEYLTRICRDHGIKVPVLLLTRRAGTGVRLLHVALMNTAIIEVSTDTLELLSSRELKAVVAHEVGHIRQGLWPISLLKALSCLALFPNFYLTLCLDWARREMDADRFAVAATGDVDALKRALVKASAAQLAYVARPRHCSRGSWARPIRILCSGWNSVMASLRFFFGDGILGYVHPYLPDRLEAIGRG